MALPQARLVVVDPIPVGVSERLQGPVCGSSCHR